MKIVKYYLKEYIRKIASKTLMAGCIKKHIVIQEPDFILKYVDNMIDKNPMPTKKEVDKRTRIGELIYVDNYTRSDGTKVDGYYRRRPYYASKK